MSKVGFYRYKISDLSEGTTVLFLKNGAVTSRATVEIKPFCIGFRLLKYLDSSGRYRFFPFNNKWELKDKSTSIGKANKFITSILTGQSNYDSLGYNTVRTISLVAESVTLDELEILKDIFNSPRVYLYVGETTDLLTDWVQVTITGDGISRMRKANSKKVAIDVTLPDIYSITMQ